MNSYSKKKYSTNWLEKKLFYGKSGFIISEIAQDRFEYIHDFLESNEKPFCTPVIYYQAFAGEGATDFLDTLTKELAGKIRPCDVDSTDSLKEIVEKVNLKMVILDRCHLHSLETLEEIMLKLSNLEISLILADSSYNLKEYNIANHPLFVHFDSISFCKNDMEPALTIVNSMQQVV